MKKILAIVALVSFVGANSAQVFAYSLPKAQLVITKGGEKEKEKGKDGKACCKKEGKTCCSNPHNTTESKEAKEAKPQVPPQNSEKSGDKQPKN
ncbi:MAG: hypothetical protein K1X82_04400 [Bacteroidia bacterium]|nr:hypothetical protein [Bacteroidia bacterium]